MHPIKRKFLPAFFLLTLISVSFLISGCAGGDTATVTIRVGNQVAKADTSSIIDRLIAALSLSTRLQADQVPIDVYNLGITIDGAGMDPITRPIPETGEITLDVPSGQARVFTVLGYDVDASRYMGGIVTKNLSPGESIVIPIQMGVLPLKPAILSISPATFAQVTIEVTTGTAYRVYRTAGFSSYPSDWGQYYPIGTTATNTYNDMAVIVNRYYRYQVSALNEYGESDIGGSSGGMDYYEYFHC